MIKLAWTCRAYDRRASTLQLKVVHEICSARYLILLLLLLLLLFNNIILYLLHQYIVCIFYAYVCSFIYLLFIYLFMSKALMFPRKGFFFNFNDTVNIFVFTVRPYKVSD